jgi:hypothetical protein
MGGDQGLMNYVVLQKEAFEGLKIERTTIMRWPGHSMEGLDLESVKAGTEPPLVIHWAGMKAMLLRNMVGSELLQFFEDYYYRRLPMGRVRRILALWQHLWLQVEFQVTRRVKLRWQIWFGRFTPPQVPVLVKEPLRT